MFNCFIKYLYFKYQIIYVNTLQLVSNDTSKSHAPPIDANDMDAVVNAANDFGASPLLVITLFFYLSS